MLEILDETIPAYDFEKLYAENKETLLGRYIEKFAGCEEGSVSIVRFVKAWKRF